MNEIEYDLQKSRIKAYEAAQTEIDISKENIELISNGIFGIQAAYQQPLNIGGYQSELIKLLTDFFKIKQAEYETAQKLL